MADITMCSGLGCPARNNCYRYTATPSEHRQSYFTTPPFDGEKCEHQWELNKKKGI